MEYITSLKTLFNSIYYVERLLNKTKNHLNGKKQTFTDLEKNDLVEIIGLDEEDINYYFN